MQALHEMVLLYTDAGDFTEAVATWHSILDTRTVTSFNNIILDTNAEDAVYSQLPLQGTTQIVYGAALLKPLLQALLDAGQLELAVEQVGVL